jgi:iron complex outermembrane recepter protein
MSGTPLSRLSPRKARARSLAALAVASVNLLRQRRASHSAQCLRLLGGALTAFLFAAPVDYVRAEEPAKAKASAPAAKDESSLMDMDLDALATVTITSVSKKEQRLADTAAAVTVLSNDDILRSGATSLPEALRLVPGLNVAQIDASTWAVSSRGFNGQFANKLLVMIDGRSVYTPLFSGVYWDVQNVLLEDVDRIEVIRGPGATVWGANAVNGVINVVTKSAKDTQGGLVYGGTGTEKTAMFGARYGAKVSDNTFLRVYAKYDQMDDTQLATGRDAADEWFIGQAGFRLDYDNEKNHGTWQGDIYDGGQLASDGYDVFGANTLGRWSHRLSDTSGVEVQAYYDRVERVDSFFDTARDTFDVTAEHTFALGKRNNVIWGVGYRFSHLETEGASPNPAFASVVDESFNTDLASAFVQDDFTVIENKLILTAGTKLEHNDFTGVEVQPSGRLTYKPAENQTIWGSVARAVRTPSEVEGRDFVRIGLGFVPPNIVPTLVGNDEVNSEELIAYELGYRIQPTKRLSVDVAAFYNDYDRLITVVGGGAPFPIAGTPLLAAPQTFVNELEGESYGGEASVTYQPLDNVRITAGYQLLWLQLHRQRPGVEEDGEGGSPRNQALLRVAYDITKQLQFDVTARYVENLPSSGIHSYIDADARLAWNATKNLQIALVGQNLLDSQHPEYPAGFGGAPNEIERAGYLKLTYKF